MAKLIDGKAIAASCREDIKNKVAALAARNINAGLAVVIVGDDGASRIYVNNKKKACADAGIASFEHALPAQTTQQALLALIDQLNAAPAVHGILVQLPLPGHIDEKTVINAILPEKDVDAFHPVNVGKIMIGDYDFLPCTPAGVMTLLERSDIDIVGKHCVVVGRSNIVGKPQAMLLLHKHATVTICHSRTKELAKHVRQADIIVAAVGIAKFITADMIKEGAVVIDVGMNRDENGKLCGDVDFTPVSERASHITPVPGGVGPMTITMLLENTVRAAKLQNGLSD